MDGYGELRGKLLGKGAGLFDASSGDAHLRHRPHPGQAEGV